VLYQDWDATPTFISEIQARRRAYKSLLKQGHLREADKHFDEAALLLDALSWHLQAELCRLRPGRAVQFVVPGEVMRAIELVPDDEPATTSRLLALIEKSRSARVGDVRPAGL
jgi:hypothetical protein